MRDTVVDLSNVTKVYAAGGAELRALDDVSLTIERGEFVAIMGSSGSGKSTLMNVLGCLDRPTAGRYVLEGADTARLTEPELARIRSSRIGFVFQSFNLLARTSALENVALPLFYSVDGPVNHVERLSRAREALRFVGLAERESNWPSQLSGGQQQRVAIARALIGQPAIVLADEPTGNLDSRTSHEIMVMLQTLNREQGVTIVVVTHEPDIAPYMDRIVTMRDGRIVSDEHRTPSQGEPTQHGTAPSPSPPSPVKSGQRTAPTLPPASAAHAGFAKMTLSAAALALWRNKMRSALTVLGVFIGVAALIAMVAIGQGANEAVRKQIESLGTNLLVVVPGATTSTGVRAGSGSASTLTVDDARALKREDPAVGAVSYLIRQLGQVEYGGHNWSTSIQGIAPAYLDTTGWHIASGRAVNENDDRDGAMVVLIGQTVYQQLFSVGENPIGATILVKGKALRVVGLLAAKGQTAFGQDQDDVVIIPFSSAERKVLGVAVPSQAQSSANPYFPPVPNPYGTPPRLTGYVNQIYVEAAAPQLVQAAIAQVTQTLRRRHRLRPSDDNDFAVRNLSQIAQTAAGSSRILALLLAAIASISLLVGGIGIMNILLVSVTERTREIGLRMAVGARRLHVLLQFLVEAVFLSVSGGIGGIVFGIAASKLVTVIAHWPTLLSPAAIVGGFAFSAAVGVFFGYYPAKKASRLDPIEALRYE
ncbi:ABC transporter permease [Trinickia soli]|uniref:Macrolide ABC transporter ATP-binding protein/permease n=1 Tax=Trinickia soli TaxID=380675 RepID=A0A2N7W9K0_9BURK|nr:ABC transporter permease [Trinickia soli]KAA0080399.1 ATP-binding cassette domain-containing protein [Paraburkholderia sp. T12-10]PMS26086.1 macrolide ABC transporter ATP-binding protein/permease [Trinickia soli]CAB3681201.1 Macrolide export ATP-binding/permease protein MacB [Trinickia soli]